MAKVINKKNEGKNKSNKDVLKTIKKVLSDKKNLDNVGKTASETLGLRWSQLMPEVEDRYRHLILRKQND